ncbi:uncharacterized protein LOC129584922 [Paramacrobiotus metropolitanus]|uniref:uncharacterized protein LOC129584922 n=1 Tax=Paramacrobiotus metropolitanus TaxID=2943436 RepID=UPI0024464688|nr:uncharacterized protein LOC129584922 [Paramacrobiotus metropolitanus]
MFQPENTFRILVTSNLHIGYAEREPERMQDAVNTLQEILRTAKSQSVDLILITGDLFNESNPSRWAVHATMNALRNNCWGNAPVSVECLNDWSKPQKDGSVLLHAPNFLDPNINVEMPVLAINGFSDDLSGLGNLSELDVLDRAGLIDFCGKVTSSDSVHIPPLLLRKGESLLCLYTLGAVREELLERLIKEKNISFSRPLDNVEETWFNLFAVHQDRAMKRSQKPTEPITRIIEPWMDLVICGREHESLTEIQQHPLGFRYIQPGSTVRVNLSPDEVPTKHALIVEICGKQSRLQAVPLKTVRPMILEHLSWEVPAAAGDQEAGTSEKSLIETVKTAVNTALEKAGLEREGNPQMPWPPVMQMNVEITGEYFVNPIKLGQEFAGVVANPKNMFKIVFKKAKHVNGLTNGTTELNGTAELNGTRHGVLESLLDVGPPTIDDFFLQNLQQQEKEGEFGVLHPKIMMKAIEFLLDKDDKQAIPDAYDWEKGRVREFIVGKEGINPDEAAGDMALYHIEHRSQEEEDQFVSHHAEVLARPPIKMTVKNTKTSGNGAIPAIKQEPVSPTMPGPLPTATAVRGRGRPRGRGGVAAAPPARAIKVESDDSMEAEVVEIPSTPLRRSGRSSTARGQPMYDGIDGEEDNASDGSEEFLPNKSARTSRNQTAGGKPGFAIRGGRGGVPEEIPQLAPAPRWCMRHLTIRSP